MTSSLATRLLAAASIGLIAFLGITGWTLDRAFRASMDDALRARLLAQLYGLLAAADLDAQDVLRLPKALPEARYAQPKSGLYAEVTGIKNAVWRSGSLLGTALNLAAQLAPGQRHYATIATAAGGTLSVLRYGVAWEGEDGRMQPYTFAVAEDLAGYNAEITRFRRNLWGWLAADTVILLILQFALLRWGLRPLRAVADDLAAIEAGTRSELAGPYPHELAGLTDNLNTLLASQRRQHERYRNALADLAHSLKTPLAVARGALEALHDAPQVRATLDEITRRMNDIVGYHLQRAAAGGRKTLGTPVSVLAVAERVIASLDKVYADKRPRCTRNIPDALRFDGDEADLLELLGNLLDNAYKWCGRRVHLEAATEGQGTSHSWFSLRIEDDGSGISVGDAERVLERGVRADQQVAGHGIGLAVVREIVTAYAGTIAIGTGGWGGAKITARLPGA